MPDLVLLPAERRASCASRRRVQLPPEPDMMFGLGLNPFFRGKLPLNLKHKVWNIIRDNVQPHATLDIFPQRHLLLLTYA